MIDKPGEGAEMDCSSPVLEICVDDLPGLHAAVSGGADRIELCSGLALGGLTPSQALTAAAMEHGVPVHVMVRPRAGDFTYDEREVDLITEDIRRFRDMGVPGIVVGAADASGRMDERALARFREAANGLAIVLHRAVDLAPDPVEAARVAAGLGYDYVLTSGGVPRASDGIATIRRMVARTAGQLTVIAGGGVTPENAATLVRETGVGQIHASATKSDEWPDNRLVEFGFATGPRRLADAKRVAALKQALAALGQGR